MYKGRCARHAQPWLGSHERRARVLPQSRLLERLKRRVLRRAHRRCERCGQQVEPGQLVVDHRLPLALGGPTTVANLWALCPSCERAKTRADLALIRELDEALRAAGPGERRAY